MSWKFETEHKSYKLDDYFRNIPCDHWETCINYDDGFFYVYGEGETKDASKFNAFRQLTSKAKELFAMWDYRTHEQAFFGNFTIIDKCAFVLWGCVYEAHEHNGVVYARELHSGRLFTLDELGVVGIAREQLIPWFHANQKEADSFNKGLKEWESTWIDGQQW